MTTLVKPINFKKWIDENRDLLKPPVGNKVIWKNGEFIVMVVGGPNNRKDFHYNETPEFFYQVEGDIILKIINNEGLVEDVEIKEGEIYLLPAKVPHSPQRKANTIGLVVEYPRKEHINDALEWYCEKCSHQLYRQKFKLENIETDLQTIFDKFYNSEKLRTCNKCNTIMTPPKKITTPN